MTKFVALRQLLAVVLCWVLGANALAESRPRIGLALSGGGARGFSHVGVLKARAGAEPIGVTLGVDSQGLKGGSGVLVGQKISLFLHEFLGNSTDWASFDLMPIPFRAVTTCPPWWTPSACTAGFGNGLAAVIFP